MYKVNGSMGMLSELNRMKKLDPVNQKHLEGYIRALTLQQLKQTSIKDRVWRIYDKEPASHQIHAP